MRKRFGAWLKASREAAGLTQLALADNLDYAYPTTISQIERGVSALPPAELSRWAAAIHLSPREVADTYLYYNEPAVWAMLHGEDPYALEELPRESSPLLRRSAVRVGKPRPSP